MCDQMCTNTIGSYACSCEAGYRLNQTTRRCSGIHTCINWYELNINAICQQRPLTQCILDINECEGVNDCQQMCLNTEGSFNCSCHAGFKLNSDGKNCTGIYKSTSS